MLGLVLTFILAGVVGLVGLALLGSVEETAVVQQAAVADSAIEWCGVNIPADLAIAEHASKHLAQSLNAWETYSMLTQGRCVATAVYCGGSEIEKLYLCEAPSGLVGGLIVLGDEILTGYGAKPRYWTGMIRRDHWEVCK